MEKKKEKNDQDMVDHSKIKNGSINESRVK
jgi:hypothetical protein